ncbi:hypothetical protein L484_026795 [Morus notabilis]|uniref:Uncharacterized protein n=1 Tax=Morus notabilis TaxID=981085 RepID=W9SD28_9ROSA|nr:hypothetical protein L484_026795 [Morus notabilis]
MKLIWVLPENRGQNSNFRPNRVKPRVNRSTGDRAVQHYRSTSSVHTDRPDRSTGQPTIRSTAQVDRFPCDPVDHTGRPMESAAREKLAEINPKPANLVPNRDISKENH